MREAPQMLPDLEPLKALASQERPAAASLDVLVERRGGDRDRVSPIDVLIFDGDFDLQQLLDLVAHR